MQNSASPDGDVGRFDGPDSEDVSRWETPIGEDIEERWGEDDDSARQEEYKHHFSYDNYPPGYDRRDA